MGSAAATNPISVANTMRPGERRKNVRFDMHFRVLLRAFGDPWSHSETTDVSASGALFVTSKPYLLNTPIEYVLTFPPELTKARQPLRVRFYAAVLRCERIPESDNLYGIAVRNTTHRYLTKEEAATFEAIESEHNASGARPLPQHKVGS